MICADDNILSQQMLSILLQAVNYAKKLFLRYAIASIGIRKSTTCIAYDAKLSVLFLPKDGA